MRQSLTLGMAFVLALAGLAGCKPGDPRTEVLKQRSRWTAELTSWIPKDDGSVAVGVKLSGPPNTTLDKLTFRISQLDAEGRTLADTWQTIDTADVPRGGPKELTFHLPSAGEVEGMAVAMVLSPTPEDEQHIVELQGV